MLKKVLTRYGAFFALDQDSACFWDLQEIYSSDF